jgi:hypothetical protein
MAGGPSPGVTSVASISPAYANMMFGAVSTTTSSPNQSLFSTSSHGGSASTNNNNNNTQSHAFLTSPSSAINDPAFAPIGTASAALQHQHQFGRNLTSITERKPLDTSASSASSLLSLSALPTDPKPSTSPDKMDVWSSSILIRRLPRGTTIDVVRALLLFAKDLVDVNFVESDSEDMGYVSAVARFGSLAAASEAHDKLDGKTLGNDARIVVEMYLPQASLGTIGGGRRNTVDGTNALRQTASNPASLAPSSAISAPRQSSRFGNTFQSLEKMSPPNGPPDVLSPASIWSPQSPLGSTGLSSKSIINDDPTDETHKLLSASIDYGNESLETGSSALYDSTPLVGMRDAAAAFRRTPAGPQIPTARLAGLSLLTGLESNHVTSPPLSLVSPRTIGPAQSPNPAMSPVSILGNGMSSMGVTSVYPPLPGAAMQQTGYNNPNRPSYPPVNPADQNPPCNTLYVGNLPMDTSEDELKAIFCKQRGYKRLCYRTKANGPMCFVEFEDTGFATRCLKQLYGHPLSNSTKGGIRLSFSKNPLGVRSSQNPSNAAVHAHAAQAAAAQAVVSMNVGVMGHPGLVGMNGHAGGPVGGVGNGVNSNNAGLFATATGPPPGLPPPPMAYGGPSSSSSGLNSGSASSSHYGNTASNSSSGNGTSYSISNGLGSSLGSLAGLGPGTGFVSHHQLSHHSAHQLNHQLAFGGPLRQSVANGVPSSMAGGGFPSSAMMSDFSYMGR